MQKQTYDNQMLRGYLLGSLPADETELFDEMSFTDDRFADELSAAEKDLTDEYARGELSGVELEKFKSYYLASPLRREKAEFARAFQIFGEKTATPQQQAFSETSEEIAPKVADIAYETKPKRSLKSFFAEIFAAPRPALQWGLAAVMLAFVFFGGWLVLENSRLRGETEQAMTRRLELERRAAELQNEIAGERTVKTAKEAELASVRDEIARLEQQRREQEQKRIAEFEQERNRLNERQQSAERAASSPKQPPRPQQERRSTVQPKASSPAPISVASFVLTPALRGGAASQIQTLSIPSETDSIALRLELEPNDFSTFRARIVSQSDGRVLWRSGALKARGAAADGKTLSVSFPARLLSSSQIYSLEVSGGATGEIISNYSFRPVLK